MSEIQSSLASVIQDTSPPKAPAQRKIANMGSRRRFGLLVPVLALLAGTSVHAQDDARHRGRKYKPPPETSHIEVVVTKKMTGKPVVNAAVIFRVTRNGKDDGNLEVKTDPDGKADIDVIATGSLVRVQVIADGFATFADDYQVDEPSREIHVALLKPREQVSAYEDNDGKASTRKPGVQEPDAPAKPPKSSDGLQQRSAPSSRTPAPDSKASPNATGTPDPAKTTDSSPSTNPPSGTPDAGTAPHS